MSRAPFTRLARAADQFATYCAVEAAATTVADATGLPVEQIKSRVNPNDVRHQRGGSLMVSAARQDTIYLSIVHFGRSLRRVGDCLGISHEAARKAVVAVEGRREDPRCDRRLDEIELELMGASA